LKSIALAAPLGAGVRVPTLGVSSLTRPAAGASAVGPLGG